MSKYFDRYLLLPTAFLLILQIFNNCSGQQMTATIKMPDASGRLVEISGRFVDPAGRNFAITRAYGGISGLADRVSDLILEDANGKPVAYKQFIPGEYVADADVFSWKYKMNLAPRRGSVLAAHTSWIGIDAGVIFLDDVLPIIPPQGGKVLADVTLELPNGWQSSRDTGLKKVNVEREVVFVAKAPRILRIHVQDADLTVTITGDWKFTDEDLRRFVFEIYDRYRQVFGGTPGPSSSIYITHFPVQQEFGAWEADTRGSTITIVSSDTAFSTQSVQRLHEQLRHEIFHLWFPNAVSLSGRYDWFYEGFALYESLKTGVALNRIRFDDLLDTLSRAYTFDSALRNRPSLLDLSANRSAGGDTDLYARGMIIAFLTDLELMRASGGKANVETLLRDLFEKYHEAPSQVDGNKAVFDLIASPLIARYVQSTEQIDIDRALQVAGIDLVKNGPSYSLKVMARPDRRQREMLDKLGYNNWRRSSVSPK